MTPSLDLSQLTPEQQAALGQLISQQVLMTAPRPEPVDANVIPNPNLGRMIPYPRMLYKHQTREYVIVKDQAEHQHAAAQGYVTEPFSMEEPTPKVKGPGFEEESDETAELRALLEEQQKQIDALMAKKPMGRRSGE